MTQEEKQAKLTSLMVDLYESINEDLAINWDDYVPTRMRPMLINSIMGKVSRMVGKLVE